MQAVLRELPGFRYVTLEGHPERGVASFALAWDDARATFRIESRSEPAGVARLGAAYARRAQRRAVEGALARMRALLEANA